MEEVVIQHEAVTRALFRLASSLKKLKNNANSIDYEEYRDSVIKRFEFTIDALQKFLKAYLVDAHGLDDDIKSPRNIFRSSLTTKIISDDQFVALIRAIEDRNRTSHTYDEQLAELIAQRIYDHEQVIRAVLAYFGLRKGKVLFRNQREY